MDGDIQTFGRNLDNLEDKHILHVNRLLATQSKIIYMDIISTGCFMSTSRLPCNLVLANHKTAGGL